MECGDKEWQHCLVEKMGCTGCYYNEIELGEYIRTKSGIIIKTDIIDFEKLTISQKGIGYDFEDVEEMKDFIKNEIVKHSNNLIDLIEVGDYLNGQLIENIYKKEKDKIYYEFLENEDGSYEVMEMCELDNIKSIVTKEQFKSVEYEVSKC